MHSESIATPLRARWQLGNRVGARTQYYVEGEDSVLS